MIIRYETNEAEDKKIRKFVEEQDAKVLEMQKKWLEENDYPTDRPYYGASGGAYSYIIVPTGIGTFLKIRNDLTKEELNVTDMDDW